MDANEANQAVQDAISSPAAVTNAAGERVESRPIQEQIAGANFVAGVTKRRLPFAITRIVPGDTVGPNARDE